MVVYTEGETLLLDALGEALATPDLNGIAQHILPAVERMFDASFVTLYIGAPPLPTAHLWQHGLPAESAAEVEKVCAHHLSSAQSRPDTACISASIPLRGQTIDLMLYPLRTASQWLGLLGMPAEAAAKGPTNLWEKTLHLLENLTAHYIEQARMQKELSSLNAYLTVSSALAQSMDLREVLDIAMWSCMDLLSAEGASLLLLDEEKQNFQFYYSEGPGKTGVEGRTFPADKGIAGAVLQSREAEIVNDVPNDPRFYSRFDTETGYRTRNMIAIPLIAGEEPVGVMEILNKNDEGGFTQQDLLLLLSVAEEIAFAIRNAIVFEYVVNTYCKQRQGLNTCRGCERPLGSWTPCVKYRERAI